MKSVFNVKDKFNLEKPVLFAASSIAE